MQRLELVGMDFDGSIKSATDLLNLAMAIHNTRLMISQELDSEVVDLVIEAKEDLVMAASLLLAEEALEVKE